MTTELCLTGLLRVSVLGLCHHRNETLGGHDVQIAKNHSKLMSIMHLSAVI